MATFLAGKGSKLSIDDISTSLTDFSPIVSNCSLQLNMDTSDVSSFGEAYKKFIAGQYSGTISFDFSYDATLCAKLAALFLAGTATDVEYAPAGDATEYGFDGIITSYTAASSVSDAVKGSVSMQITGAVALA